MNINRHNYEEYFLLYVDNELTVIERKAVEEFVLQNPDLEEELVMLKQSVVHPNSQVVFGNKETLLKNVPEGLINGTNYEEYFVLYSDNELTNNQKDLVEQFVDKHPQYRQEFELIQQAKLLPDNTIVFPDKNYLYRTEEDDKVVPFPWRKLAVAAVFLLFMGGFAWYVALNNHPGTSTGPAQPATTNDGIARVDTNTTKKNTVPTDQLAVKPVTDQTPAPAANDKKSVTVPKTNEPQKETMAAVNPKKIVAPDSNKKVNEIVPPIQEDPIDSKLAMAALNVVPTTDMTRPAAVKATMDVRDAKETRSELKIPETQVVYVDAQPDDEIYADNNSSNKRPLRGFFRKVTRVFDKATNKDDGETNKKGIRIANFEIALNK